MNIYLAAPWIEKEKMPSIAEEFEKVGHRITHKWWESEESPNEDEAYRDPLVLRQAAVKDYLGVYSSQVVVTINSAKSEGKATEQGIALAFGKPIIAIGELGKVSKNVFHYLPCYKWVPDVDKALEFLKDAEVIGQWSNPNWVTT